MTITKLKKILKGIGASIYLLIEFIILILIVFAFGIRTSYFQTKLAHIAASYLSGELGTEVRIDKVDIVFLDIIDIEGVFLEDIRHDTLLYADKIRVNIGDFSLSESYLDVDAVNLSKTTAKIIQYEGDTTFNFQHLVDYFASNEEDTTSSNFKVNVKKLALSDINFIYQDQNAEKTDFGLDYSNLNITHLSGEFSEFSMINEDLMVRIEDLHFQEQSGFVLSKLSADILYNSKVIGLENLTLAYNNSILISDKLILNTPNGSADFSDFVHAVYFKGNLRNSLIDMGDIAYFAPSIYGMDTKINLNQVNISGPVYGMRLDSLDLSLLAVTKVIGNFQIPDLDHPEEALFEESILLFQTSVEDIQTLKLTPFLDGDDYIVLPESMKEAGLIQLKNGHFTGFMTDFQADGVLTSGIGNISSEYGLRFFQDEEGIINYQSSLSDGVGRDLIVENLDLGALSGSSMLGKTSGYLSIAKGSKGMSMDQMDLRFTGEFSEFELDGYNYHNISIHNGQFQNSVFSGEIDIKDDNLAMSYEGLVDLKGDMKFDFTLVIDSTSLTKLNYNPSEFPDRLQTKVEVHIQGASLEKMTGTIAITDLDYKEGDIDFQLQSMELRLNRNAISDTIDLKSDYVDLNLTGKFDLVNVYPVVQHQLAKVMGHIVNETDVTESKNEYYDLRVNLKNINPLFQFLEQDITVAAESKIRSTYSKQNKKLSFEFTSDLVTYEDIKISDILLKNNFDSVRASIQYEIGLIKISDDLGVKNAALFSYIKNNHFSTNIGWDSYGEVEPALFAFTTEIDEEKNVITEFNPSFFFLKSEKWSISPKSKVVWNPDLIEFTEFDITNKNHLVNVDGKVSKDPNDWLYFQIRDFDLADLNGILDGAVTLGGVLNVDGGVSDVYDNIRFMSLSEIKDLYVDGELVGDLLVDNKWNKEKNSVEIFGNLKRGKKETFKFSGNYFPEKPKENLKLDLIFDNTDISFLNAFSDPELYTDIDGILTGNIKVTGELTSPAINGELNLMSVKVKVPMLNVRFGLDGELKFSPSTITSQNLKIYDEEGNKADLSMNISHRSWADWKYKINMDMISSGTDRRFLAMNTNYNEGDFYYGKAYVNGEVSVTGTTELTEMNINATTLRGTDLKLAMYGSSDLEESSFIVFDTILPSKRKKEGSVVNQLESSGLIMNMNFNISKETKATIIFDPIYEDQIVIEQGEGNLELNLDEYGEMEMRGKYTILQGKYFMRVKGLVKKDFILEPSSNLAWTGSPYDAYIDITAKYKAEVSLDPILPPGIEDRSGQKETVYAVLSMGRTLMNPQISFGIIAPDADDVSKTALRSIEADQDELNKQFFSLLTIGRFISVNGGSGGSGNAAIDFAEGQINEILNSVSGKYDIAADLGGDKRALDFSTQLSDRITITTSVGVVSSSEASSGGLIGDVVIEYRLNDDGSFTVNAFNKSNQGTDAEKGPFTQGVSFHYEETFDNAKEFKLLQGFLNIFRKKEKDFDFKKEKSNGKKKPVKGAKEKIVNGS